MTTLRLALERYLSMRQGLGYKYRDQARRLRDFVSFMEARKARTITTKLALAWATLPPRSQVSSARRLNEVRGFARHVASIDPKTEVPPSGNFPQRKRLKPSVYSDAEINALLAAAPNLAARSIATSARRVSSAFLEPAMARRSDCVRIWMLCRSTRPTKYLIGQSTTVACMRAATTVTRPCCWAQRATLLRHATSPPP